MANEAGVREAQRGISRRMIALFKEFVGRGPTRARTYISDQLVIVVLEDTLTKAERTLVAQDRIAMVRELRRSFQDTMRERARALVEEELGVGVRTVFGDHSVAPDVAFEAFVLDSSADERPPAGESDADDSQANGAISSGMVALFKRYVGRGPANAWGFADGDVVSVLLEDTLTTAERNLANDQRASLVREVRRQFQGAMRDDAVAMVERHLDRPVWAFLSDHSVYPDYALEVFVLQRDGTGT